MLKRDEVVCKKLRSEIKKILAYSKTCDYCLRISINSHRCSTCLSAQYCSQSCVLKDREFHESVCATWAKDEKRQMPDNRGQKKSLKKLTKTVKKIELGQY